MKYLKLAVCSAFVIGLAALLLLRSDHVAGQGGTQLAAPTGVLASDSVYSNKVTIWWDAIRGATSYRVFRNTINDPQTATELGTTAAGSFFDNTATPGQTFFYWVRAENAGGVSPLSNADQGTRANATGQGQPPPLQPPPPAPPGNERTATKAFLGKTLFWDEQMASTKTVACGTCHHSATGGIDPRSPTSQTSINPGPDLAFGTQDDIHGSPGVPVNNLDGTYTFSTTYGLSDQVTGRRSVSYINAAYSPLLFWDGRATGIYRDPITNNIVLNGGAALESQSSGPPTSTAEMGHNGRDWNDVASRIAASKPLALSMNVPEGLAAWISGRTYPELFQEAFGTPDVTPTRISMAIATFERTLYSDQSPWDLDAGGIQNLSAAAQRGRGVFNANSCIVCHAGNRFTDESFRDIGVRPPNEDLGRGAITGQPQDTNTFRVPSLRNVGLRTSYFHNGEFTSLNQVVDFYNRGGDFRNNPNVPRNLIRPLGLNQGQRNDLVAFLQSLTDARVANESSIFDRPTLYMESTRVPEITGSGRSGSGGITPQIKAISPPLVGNPNFTVSVSAALGNSEAVLVIDSSDPGVGTTIPSAGSFARLTATTQNTGAGNGWQSLSPPIPDNAALVGQTFFARWYITDLAATNGFSVSPAVRFTVFGQASAPGLSNYIDFDGDGRTDISVFRPTEGNWYILNSSDGSFSAKNFGIATDRLAPADFDGDGKTDVAVFRDGVWYMSRSRDGFAALLFGQAGDIAQPGDFDGDGIADPAVFRPSTGTWYMLRSRDGFAAVQFGIVGDRPVASDFDGDGKIDQAVYRGNGDWYVAKSTGGDFFRNFGLADDKPVVGDYDADGRADLAVFRPSNGTWYYIRSSDGGERWNPFGVGTDVPSPGDFDGDGSNDLAVYRGGIWYVQQSTGGFRATQFGISTDTPVPSMIVP